MRFFCRFKREEAANIKALFNAVGIGKKGGPSVRQFTKTAILKEVNNLAQLYKKHQESQDTPEEDVEESS